MSLSRGKKLLFPLGQFGLVLTSYGALKYFSTFYISNTAKNAFPLHLYQGYLFGFFTVAGLIIALSKLTDVAASILSGWLSDKRVLTRGKRTDFMVISAIPLAALSVLIFSPPTASHFQLNSVAILIYTILFFIFLSLYTTPYLALLAEIGKSPRARLQLSMLMSCATAFASLIGHRAFSYVSIVQKMKDLDSANAFRLVMFGYAVISAVCLLIPALFLGDKQEKMSCDMHQVVETSFTASFSAVLKDNYFRHFLVSDIMYRLASACIIAGFSYYVTGLLGLSEEKGSFLLLVIFFTNLALYVPVYFAVSVFGKRKILFAAFFMFMIFLPAAFFAGMYPFPVEIQGFLFAILLAIPIAIFSVVPHALVADLVVASERKTGILRSGIYFGIHNFAARVAQMLVALVLPLVMSFGLVGIRITLVIAAVCSLVGFVFLFGYREKEVAVLLEKDT